MFSCLRVITSLFSLLYICESFSYNPATKSILNELEYSGDDSDISRFPLGKNFPEHKRRRLSQLITNLELNGDRSAFPNLWEKLDGEWLLLYTNNADSIGSLPLLSPSSSAFIKIPSVLTLERVVQKISQCRGYKGASLGDLEYSVDNILHIKTPIVSSRIALRHTCYIVSNTEPATLAIELDSIENSLLPMASIDLTKFLGSPSCLRRGFFDTTYCDGHLRISR